MIINTGNYEIFVNLINLGILNVFNQVLKDYMYSPDVYLEIEID